MVCLVHKWATIELVNLCVGEENISREKSVCRYDLAEKFLLILIEPCYREHLRSVFSYFMPSYNIVYVHNCEMCKKSLISGGWSVAR